MSQFDDMMVAKWNIIEPGAIQWEGTNITIRRLCINDSVFYEVKHYDQRVAICMSINNAKYDACREAGYLLEMGIEL